MDITPKPAILSNKGNNANLYKNLYLYEALHDFSKTRGNIEGLGKDNIKNYIGLYKNVDFPKANDEDRFIEEIDNHHIYDPNGQQIIEGGLISSQPFTEAIDYFNQYIYSNGDIDMDLKNILDNNDEIDVYFDYYKENKGKWLDLTTVSTLKQMISHIFTINDDDSYMRFLVDTCKMNLALVYYNTTTMANETVYQVVDETNKWDMASTRKNKTQLDSECIFSNASLKPIAKDVLMGISMSIPISSSKSKKEFRKISYNLLSENLMNSIKLNIKFPEDKLDSSLDYLYVEYNEEFTKDQSEQFVLVPTNTIGITIGIANIVYSDRPVSTCYSTTILTNTSTNNSILLVNPYAYSKSNVVDNESDGDSGDNAKGVFSVNKIKTLLDDESSDVYRKLRLVHKNNKDIYNSLLFDIKRSGDWSQILAVYKKKDTHNNVFITIDRMAYTYAKLLKVPAILTSKDFGSDTYRFKMYRDRTTLMNDLEKADYLAKIALQVREKETNRYISATSNTYLEKYTLAKSLRDKIANTTFNNNISDIDHVIKSAGISFAGKKTYIDNLVLSIWNLYMSYVNANFNTINTIGTTINLPEVATTVNNMLIQIPLLDNIIDTFNTYFSLQSYIDSNRSVLNRPYRPSNNHANMFMWLDNTIKGSTIFPIANGYLVKILENFRTLFVGHTVRTYKINEENIVHIIAGINGLTMLAGYGTPIPVLTKTAFTQKQLITWCETTTNKLISLKKAPDNQTKTKVKPVHIPAKSTRSSGRKKSRGGYIPPNYTYFLSKKVGTRGGLAKPDNIYSAFEVLDEFVGTPNVILSGSSTTGYKINNDNKDSFIDSYGITYLKEIFTPAYKDLVKCYIKYSIYSIGLDIDSIEDNNETAKNKLEFIYRYFYTGVSQNVAMSTTSEFYNINDMNNYLDIVENSLPDSITNISNGDISIVYSKIDIDIANNQLDEQSKILYYYLLSYAITDIGLFSSNKNIPEDFVIEPFENYYRDLEQLIAMLRDTEKAIGIQQFGGSTGISIDSRPNSKYTQYYKQLDSAYMQTARDLLATGYGKYNVLSKLAQNYIAEFKINLTILNNYYIRLAMDTTNINSIETYMGISATIKSSYAKIEDAETLYRTEYLTISQFLEKVQVETSRLVLYHDSTIATLPILYTPITLDRDVEDSRLEKSRAIDDHLTSLLIQAKDMPALLDDTLVTYVSNMLEHLSKTQVAKFDSKLIEVNYDIEY